MRKSPYLLLAWFGLTACSGANRAVPPTEATPTHASAGTCQPGAPETWSACEGVSMAVRGMAPSMVHNHPNIANSPMGGDARQVYLDVGEVQIIVVTEDTADCVGPMTAEGRLTVIDLGGPEGTRQSYRGLAIRDATVRCES